MLNSVQRTSWHWRRTICFPLRDNTGLPADSGLEGNDLTHRKWIGHPKKPSGLVRWRSTCRLFSPVGNVPAETRFLKGGMDLVATETASRCQWSLSMKGDSQVDADALFGTGFGCEPILIVRRGVREFLYWKAHINLVSWARGYAGVQPSGLWTSVSPKRKQERRVTEDNCPRLPTTRRYFGGGHKLWSDWKYLASFSSVLPPSDIGLRLTNFLVVTLILPSGYFLRDAFTSFVFLVPLGGIIFWSFHAVRAHPESRISILLRFTFTRAADYESVRV